MSAGIGALVSHVNPVYYWYLCSAVFKVSMWFNIVVRYIWTSGAKITVMHYNGTKSVENVKVAGNNIEVRLLTHI